MSNADVTLVADLGYGDAGKGSVVDALVRRGGVNTVVRYNGGAQAAHTVVTPDRKTHIFRQFGSGTFSSGVRTYLSRFMLLDPISLFAESAQLADLGVADAITRLAVDKRTPIITPYHVAANRLKEMHRGGGRHGSCGMGIGETAWDLSEHPEEVLRAGDLLDPVSTIEKLRFHREMKLRQLASVIETLPQTDPIRDELARLVDDSSLAEALEAYGTFAAKVAIVDDNFLGEALRSEAHVVFEGAQGVLLDEWYSFFPYATRSTTTFSNALTLLDELGHTGAVNRLGLIRGYSTRHGAGPFVTEDTELTEFIPDYHNGMNDWQREFRVGWLDLVATRYAIEAVGGVDSLGVTCLDRLEELSSWKTCNGYRFNGSSSDDLDRYFGRSGDVISDIKVLRPTTLMHQTALTEHIFECEPVLDTFLGRDPEAYLEFLSERLRTPVGITSRGVSALAKRFR